MTDDVSVVPSICVFDVNETLLDIESIAPLFQRLFGDRKVLREWFGQLVLYSNAITLSGPYTTFFTLGQGVLKMLGSIHSVSIQQADIDELRMRMLTMPAHPDVPAGLKQLKEAGFRLVTLTNSPPDPLASPLKHAGIDGWFEKSFSIDRVRRFKPAPQVYHMVAEELDVHGGGARVGYDGSAERWLFGSAHRQTGQCSAARAWVAATAGCRGGSAGRGHAIDQALALIVFAPNSVRGTATLFDVRFRLVEAAVPAASCRNTGCREPALEAEPGPCDVLRPLHPGAHS
jgi:2-haloalkanoic acid dehalogenase type II